MTQSKQLHGVSVVLRTFSIAFTNESEVGVIADNKQSSFSKVASNRSAGRDQFRTGRTFWDGCFVRPDTGPVRQGTRLQRVVTGLIAQRRITPMMAKTQGFH